MALDAGGGAGRGPSARPGVAGSAPPKPAVWMRGSELTSAARVPASQPASLETRVSVPALGHLPVLLGLMGTCRSPGHLSTFF